MISSSHRQAEDLSGRAAIALRQGKRVAARKLYAQAAAFEELALADVPASLVRTRAAMAVGIVSLLYKGRLWQKAEVAAYRFLSDPNFDKATFAQLKELLESVLDEKALDESEKAYSGEGVELRLRGGKIGFGTAPLDALLHVYEGFRSLMYRTAEYAKGLEFRVKGLPIQMIRDVVEARTSQPLAGSYRLLIRFIEPAQMKLFEKPDVQPADVAGTLFDFVQGVAAADDGEIARTIPDPTYRRAMLKLFRNISPDGRQVSELEFVGLGTLNRTNVLVTPLVRDSIKASLGPAPGQPIGQELEGILRGLDLEKRFLDLYIDGQKTRVFTSDVILDDVVGPLVNQRVRVTGVHQRRGRAMFADVERA